MKRLTIVMAFISLALLSCEKDKGEQSPLTGTYTGTFQRVSATGNGPLSQITITFTGDEFTGTSEYSTYPGLCKGTFTIDGNTVEFVNTCAWTANFDWTLILNGEYDFTLNGNNLEIRKAYNGTDMQEDVYKLMRQ